MKHLRCLAVLLAFSSLVACGSVAPSLPDAGPFGDDDAPDAEPPDPPPACVTAADCTDPGLAFCVDGACVECDDADACTSGAPVCSASDHSCGACTMAAECEAYADTPACGPDGTCVECVSSSDCHGPTPVCEDLTCRGCELDDECASGACDFDTGRCYQPSEIVHVSPTGAASTPCGSAAAPCGSLTIATTLVSATRPIIRMHEGTYGAQNITSAPAAFIVHGAGASIVLSGLPYTAALFTGNGIDGTFLGLAITVNPPTVSTSSFRAVDVNVGTRVELRDTVIRTTGTMTTGIESEGDLVADRIDVETTGYAIASYGGSLTLGHSVVQQSYGVHVGASTFSITNTVFRYNRSTAVTIDSPLGATKRLDHNTFIGNGSTLVNGATELNVIRTVFPNPATRFASRGNLMSNARPYTWNGSTGIRLHGGGAPSMSLLDMPNHPLLLDGNGYGPAHVSPDGHLTAASQAIDGMGLTTSLVADDMDGQARPVGPRPDIGADEYTP